MPKTEELSDSTLKLQQKSMKLIEPVTTHPQFLQILTKLTTHPLIHPPDSSEN